MKFVTGLLTGVALGAAGAVYYSVKSGRDLRSMYEEIRAEVDAGNYEALGQRVERGFTELQAEIEDRVNQVRTGAQSALDQVKDNAEDVAGNRGLLVLLGMFLPPATREDQGERADLGADDDDDNRDPHRVPLSPTSGPPLLG